MSGNFFLRLFLQKNTTERPERCSRSWSNMRTAACVFDSAVLSRRENIQLLFFLFFCCRLKCQRDLYRNRFPLFDSDLFFSRLAAESDPSGCGLRRASLSEQTWSYSERANVCSPPCLNAAQRPFNLVRAQLNVCSTAGSGRERSPALAVLSESGRRWIRLFF